MLKSGEVMSGCGTPRTRLSRGKSRKLKASPLIKCPPSSAGDANVESPASRRRGSNPAPSPTITPPVQSIVNVQFRNYDQYTESPFHIPNSQAPVPGRDVEWELDTPISRKVREQIIKKIESTSTPESERPPPPSALDPGLPPVNRVTVQPGKRMSAIKTAEDLQEGELALRGLLELCNNSTHSESKNETKESVDMFGADVDFRDENMNGDDENFLRINKSVKSSDSLRFDDSDPFTESPTRIRTGTTLNESLFGGDDDSFLIQATQAAEKIEKEVKPATNIVNSKVSNLRGLSTKPADATDKEGMVKGKAPVLVKEEVKLKIPVKVVDKIAQNKSVQRIKDELNDGFGSGDDSFDEFMSQIPPDPVKNSDKKPISAQKPKMETIDEFPDDSFGEIVETQVVSPNSPVLKKRRSCFSLEKPSQARVPVPFREQKNHSNVSKPSALRKHSTFDSGITIPDVKPVVKKTFQRVASTPVIPSVTDNSIKTSYSNDIKSKQTGKEDVKQMIARKKQEALAKRALSLSQKQGR